MDMDRTTENMLFIHSLKNLSHAERVEIMTKKTQEFLDKSAPVALKVINGVKGIFGKAKAKVEELTAVVKAKAVEVGAKVKETVTAENVLKVHHITGDGVGQVIGSFVDGFKDGWNKVTK